MADRAGGLQCLSAVWPLRPRYYPTETPQQLDVSPMPFGCVAFEATRPIGCLGLDRLHVSNAFRLCGL